MAETSCCYPKVNMYPFMHFLLDFVYMQVFYLKFSMFFYTSKQTIRLYYSRYILSFEEFNRPRVIFFFVDIDFFDILKNLKRYSIFTFRGEYIRNYMCKLSLSKEE